MQDIFFCPDLWRLDAQVATTVGGKKELIAVDGTMTEVWQIGDWNYNWSTIRTDLKLVEGEEYCLRFWLNGGENDRFDEICNLEVFTEEGWDQRMTFKLNRGFTTFEKYKNGWYLFAVPFKAPGEHVTLRFNVMSAVATFAPADNYEQFEDIASDEENYDKPQRHNIVFKNGWPSSDSDEAFSFDLAGNEVRITKGQLKTGAKIAGGLLVGALVIHALRKKK